MNNAEITVTGNLGKDVELKFSKTNVALAKFSIGHTPRVQQDGQWQDGETMWFRVTAFGSKAEAVADTLKQGDAVMVTGSLKQTTYTDKEGKERTSLEIAANEVAIVVKNPARTQKKDEDTPPW